MTFSPSVPVTGKCVISCLLFCLLSATVTLPVHGAQLLIGSRAPSQPPDRKPTACEHLHLHIQKPLAWDAPHGSQMLCVTEESSSIGGGGTKTTGCGTGNLVPYPSHVAWGWFLPVSSPTDGDLQASLDDYLLNIGQRLETRPTRDIVMQHPCQPLIKCLRKAILPGTCARKTRILGSA